MVYNVIMLLILLGNSSCGEQLWRALLSTLTGKRRASQRPTARPPQSEPVGGLCRFRSRSFFVLSLLERINSWDESLCLYGYFQWVRRAQGKHGARRTESVSVGNCSRYIMFGVKQQFVFDNPISVLLVSNHNIMKSCFDTAISLAVKLFRIISVGN